MNQLRSDSIRRRANYGALSELTCSNVWGSITWKSIGLVTVKGYGFKYRSGFFAKMALTANTICHDHFFY